MLEGESGYREMSFERFKDLDEAGQQAVLEELFTEVAHAENLRDNARQMAAHFQRRAKTWTASPTGRRVEKP